MSEVDLLARARPRPRAGGRVLGASLIAGVVAFAAIGPAAIAIDPLGQDLSAVLAAPGAAHLLGTDHLGRSMLARLAHGTRISLGLAVLTALTAAIPGTLLGLIAAWRGGWIARGLSLVADAVLALPGLLLVLLLAAFAPGEFLPLYVGLALALWVEYFRVVRASAAALLARPQVEAARLLGFGPLHIVRRHLVPELAPLVSTLVAFSVGAAVLAISTLSFVGIGLRPPVPEWGSMMTELLPYYDEAPAQLLMPAALLFATVLGLQPLAGRDPR
jgi:peptide/nickel transport system permease protein